MLLQSHVLRLPERELSRWRLLRARQNAGCTYRQDSKRLKNCSGPLNGEPAPEGRDVYRNNLPLMTSPVGAQRSVPALTQPIGFRISDFGFPAHTFGCDAVTGLTGA